VQFCDLTIVFVDAGERIEYFCPAPSKPVSSPPVIRRTTKSGWLGRIAGHVFDKLASNSADSEIVAGRME
jgi:hypothetical protein